MQVHGKKELSDLLEVVIESVTESISIRVTEAVIKKLQMINTLEVARYHQLEEVRQQKPASLYLNAREVSQLVGVSKTTLWRMERAGQFPSRRQVSPGRVAWLTSEVERWVCEAPSRKNLFGQRGPNTRFLSKI